MHWFTLNDIINSTTILISPWNDYSFLSLLLSQFTCIPFRYGFVLEFQNSRIDRDWLRIDFDRKPMICFQQRNQNFNFGLSSFNRKNNQGRIESSLSSRWRKKLKINPYLNIFFLNQELQYWRITSILLCIPEIIRIAEPSKENWPQTQMLKRYSKVLLIPDWLTNIYLNLPIHADHFIF